jgi:pyruvate/2-oxoglutarate dehydrogenase complex dihydrolipoamide dehydrogenase (E3) component
MTTTEEYDAIVIGAGQAGNPLSRALASAGWRTALVERAQVGGTCINEGCTPTKTMVASARVAHLARRADDYGVRAGPVTVDMARVRQRKRDMVESFRSSNRQRIEGTEDLDLLMGEARFVAPKEVEVSLNGGGTRRLTADTIVINAGGRPRVPDLLGIEEVPYLDSTTIMELGQVPEHLLVLGGGYIGVEFGQMFRRFGSHVTIVQRRDQLLAREDADVAEEVAEILREDGIELLLEAHPVRVDRAGDGSIELAVRAPGGERTLGGSHLLVAAGRVPNTDSLNPEAAGIELDGRGYIRVNGRLETNVPGIYAAGDIKGGPAFTHISYDDYRILEANLLDKAEATMEGRMVPAATIEGRLVPYTVFIDPQLGRVGLSEGEARAQGRDVRVAKMPMTWVARALETDETRGLMKAVVDADTDQILGAAILSVEGGEIMAMLQVAMMGGLPYTALGDGIFTHPSWSEALNTLFTTLEK